MNKASVVIWCAWRIYGTTQQNVKPHKCQWFKPAPSRPGQPDTAIICMTFQIVPLYLMAGKLFMTAVSALTTLDTSS